MSRIITITGKKGGIGKTTSTIHTAAALADKGFKTCVIDFDPSQGNATKYLVGPIWKTDPERKGICSVIVNGELIDNVIMQTARENLYVVPSEKLNHRGQPFNIEKSLGELSPMDGGTALRDVIDESAQLKEMDFIFIDNAPNLGLTVINSLVASDYYLIPVLASDFSIEAVEESIDMAERTKEFFGNDYLQNLGFFLSRVDKRPKNTKMAIDELTEYKESMGMHFFEAQIPISAKFDFLSREQKTIYDITKTSERAHKDYLHLVDEILERIMSLEQSFDNQVQQGGPHA